MPIAETDRSSTRKTGRRMLVALSVGWLIAVVAGLTVVARYDNAPGAPADASRRWPNASRLARHASTATLVVVAHPLCSCTQATLAELAEVLARARRPVTTYVIFAKPAALRRESPSSDLWARAAAIPGVTPVADDGGGEAALFGASTSGQMYVYSPDGDLLFAGGTTPSRGHQGDNVGRRSIIAALNRTRPEQVTAPVFGCALRGPADALAASIDPRS
jgi:hypothetical protein